MDLAVEEISSAEEEELEKEQNKNKKRVKKPEVFNNIEDVSSEEEDDDDDEVREIMKDLIEDDSIVEESGSDDSSVEESDSDDPKKRKISDDEEDSDSLEDDEYDLLEENLGIKVKRKKYKRLRRIESSDEEEEMNLEEVDMEISTEEEKLQNSETDSFIVESDDRSMAEKRKTQKKIFNDAALQEAKEMFGIDFNYDNLSNDEEDDEQDKMPSQNTNQGKPPNKSILEAYEPSELRRNFLTDVDNRIRKTDIPERMQLRNIPISTVRRESNELNEEANWIYQQAFSKHTISTQAVRLSLEGKENLPKGPQTIPKIRKTLEFLRNQHLEVPFIASYRKEYIQPELNINDLWRIYKFEERWCQFKQDKENLLSLIQSLRKEHDSQIPITEYVGAIKDSDIEFLKNVQTFEELQDVNKYIYFYHCNDIKNLQAKEVERRRFEKREEEPASFKYANLYDIYGVFKKAGLDGLVNKFGLTPQKFAENLRDNYQRHEVEQEACSVEEIARQYVCPKFPTESDVLHAAENLVALQISKQPIVKRCVREVFFKWATITVRPTQNGVTAIDEDHNCYSMKCLKNKPVKTLTGDQFLKLNLAQKEKLLTVTINDTIKGNSSDWFIYEVKQFYVRNEFSKLVQDWNTLRGKCIERAFTEYIFPDLKTELENILLKEAKESIVTSCCKKMYDWLKVAPYRAKFSNEDHGWETSKGLRVMAIAYALGNNISPFTCIAAPHGVITEYLKLPHLLKRKNCSWQQKQAIITAVRNFIYMHKPHLIVIGGESRDALMILKDIQDVISDLVQSKGFPSIEVEIIDNEFAKVYANSNQGKSDFPTFPELLLQAVSLARKMQDPLTEYAQLCNCDNEILSLQYHPLQKEIPEKELLENLLLEFINRTNEVGVDINQAIKYPNTSKLLQFVGGLGPRKAQALLKVMKQTTKKIETRTELIMLCHIGPIIFINCSGFIKIDTDSLDHTATGVNPLECSRIHLESYNWAIKMAVDALENDNNLGLNPNDAVVEIFNSPEQLDELDLDIYAEELERNGFGYKNITLYDIRTEFHSPYKDLRFPYVSPNSDELFVMLTKLPFNTLHVGKLITGQVTEVLFIKPKLHQIKTFIPRRDGRNNCWSCVFCKNDTFEELEGVWKHFDIGKCPGKAKVVKMHFDYGISGSIFISKFSDSFVKNLQDSVSIGEVLNCRILTIDKEKFFINCTSKHSDLIDEDNKFKPKRDSYYDYEDQQDEKDKKSKREIDSNNKQHKIQYTRGCDHPYFKNVSFSEAEQYLAGMSPGEIIIRPSSRKPNYIVFTWKVADNIYQHIEVLEENKINNYAIGSILRIDDQQFEELEEIIATHVNPMATFSRDLLYFKYYKDTNGGMKDRMEKFLYEETRKNSLKIHYFVSASKNYPGKFLLSYLPGDKCKHEYITITPKGYQFRQQLFCSIDLLFNWFKLHFNDSSIVVASPTTPQHSVKKVTSSCVPCASFQETKEDLLGTRRKTLSAITNQTHSYSSTPSDSHNTPSAKTPYRTPVELPTLNYGQTTETVAFAPSRRRSPAHSSTTLPNPRNQ